MQTRLGDPEILRDLRAGASPLRATATTSRRNSIGNAFGMINILPARTKSSHVRSQPNQGADAMGEARYFVLLASPEAARSPWVNREIAHWLVTKPADTLMPVLTDGTLVWDNELGDFDPASSSALPPALVGAFADEPRHLDMRWRDEAQLDLRHSRFRSQVATMAAPMHGIAREDLEGEDVRPSPSCASPRVGGGNRPSWC